MSKLLIVNADDLGASSGVNRGIADCHTRGVVTSASLMVTGAALEEALEVVAEHPRLSVGLHLDLWGEDERPFDAEDVPAVRAEFSRQIDRFHELLGRGPTHVDSHRHAHREPQLFEMTRELVETLGVPLRGDGSVKFVGGFYAQWEWGVTELQHVSIEAFERILRAEVGEGWTEISCHPGYRSDDYRSMYLREREVEVATLTDPRAREAIGALGIDLVGYVDYPAAAGSSR